MAQYDPGDDDEAQPQSVVTKKRTKKNKLSSLSSTTQTTSTIKKKKKKAKRKNSLDSTSSISVDDVKTNNTTDKISKKKKTKKKKLLGVDKPSEEDHTSTTTTTGASSSFLLNSSTSNTTSNHDPKTKKVPLKKRPSSASTSSNSSVQKHKPMNASNRRLPPSRSRSGDLELRPQSSMKNVRTGIPVLATPNKVPFSRSINQEQSMSRSSRRLPARTKSSDLDDLVSGARRTKQQRLPPPDKRRIPQRSRSGDLELLPQSSMRNLRTDIQPSHSILRNSSHHSKGNASVAPRIKDPSVRARFDEMVASRVDDDSDSDVSVEVDIAPVKPIRSARPGLGPKGGVLRSSNSLTSLSGHSLSQSTRSLMNTSLRSTRSLMTVEQEEEDFPDDRFWQGFFRYIRLLPPRRDEKAEKRRIRHYIWATLLLDFIAAMVSITTYNGVTTCCGVPIFSLSFINFNWSHAIRITTYVYLVMVFAEIIPVVRRGLPFNLLNPMVGFMISFAMFFDDRITEAICMWLLETTAICLEVCIFRIQRKMYHDRFHRLDDIETTLTTYKQSSRKLNSSQSSMRSGLSMASSHSNKGSSHSNKRHDVLSNSNKDGSSHSKKRLVLLSSNSCHSNIRRSGGGLSISGDDDSDDESISGHSFGDDSNDDDDDGDVENPTMNSSSSSIEILLPKSSSSSNHKLREVRLLRERRILRQRQKDERRNLHFHLAGVVINLSLTIISFLLIVVISSSGGLCVRSDVRPVIFAMNQLERCDDCRGQIIDGRCEICSEDGMTMQCYYQYI
jgi:hypothetical protein